MPSRSIVTRFAPSPTGFLHVGGARTALFNWAYARRHGGTFILRMEDTDAARSSVASTRAILSDLRWLGIDWDEGPAMPTDARAALDPAFDPMSPAVQRGQRGPYFQSQRGELYRQYLQKLIDTGRAYEDKGAWRFRMPGRAITVRDQVLGEVTIQAENLEDFVIFKGEGSGGGPTFHFANVVDDATMGVTHVLRAQEHLMNTPKHLALFEALGLEPPVYAHMPLIFNADGSKMSKRDKAKAARQAAQQRQLQPAALASLGHAPETIQAFLNKKSDDAAVAVAIGEFLGVPLPEIDVHDFAAAGYLPGVLLNYLSLLGWSPENKDRVGERFDVKWFVENFAIEGIGKTNARFDRAKLLAFNGEALQKLPMEDYVAGARAYNDSLPSPIWPGSTTGEDRFTEYCRMYQPRARTWRELATAGAFLWLNHASIVFDPKSVEKVLQKNDTAGVKVLRELRDLLHRHDDWTAAAIHTLIESFAAQTGRGMGDVAQPLRVAVSGTTVSPPIHETLAWLGQQSVIARIDACLAACAG